MIIIGGRTNHPFGLIMVKYFASFLVVVSWGNLRCVNSKIGFLDWGGFKWGLIHVCCAKYAKYVP